MINILIKKVKAELNDVYGVSAIGISKNIIYVYVFEEYYKNMINTLLNAKLNKAEMDKIKIIVTGHIVPALD